MDQMFHRLMLWVCKGNTLPYNSVWPPNTDSVGHINIIVVR